MRAVLCDRLGGPEVLGLAEVALPPPGPDEIIVEVHAAGVNFADLLMIAGSYQEKPPLPFTPGLEAAGVVAAVGAGVGHPKLGDRVLALTDRGAFAERALARASDVFPIPESMDFITAAGFPIAYGTAHGALTWRAGLRSGELVLVLGAAGGTGLAAVGVAKALGAIVIAGARGTDKLALAAAHGADHLIDTGSEDIRARVKDFAAARSKRGADLVFDPVGGAGFEAALRALAWGGRHLVIGFAAGSIPQIPATLLLIKNLAAIGFYWGSYRRFAPEMLATQFTELVGWHARGKLAPHISRTFDLGRAGEALALMKSRKSTGKLVLTTGRES